MPDFLGRGVLWPTDPVPGFIGTGSAARVAVDTAPIFYVDSGHVLANDDNDGTDPDAPLATIQAIIDRTAALAAGTGTRQPVLRDYSVIYVSGDVDEDVVTDDFTASPSYVSIIGVGPSPYGPRWNGADADTPSLDLLATGWRVSGFRFIAKSGAACIELRYFDVANGAASKCVITGNKFYGFNGLYGIVSHGAPEVEVTYNIFEAFHNGTTTATCLEVGTTPVTVPKYNYIAHNRFVDCDNGVRWESEGSFFIGNVLIVAGPGYTMTDVFQTDTVANAGDNNVVTGNLFPGDYSIAGGYRGGAADVWVGNFADDVAEAEVGDNGITLAVPT